MFQTIIKMLNIIVITTILFVGNANKSYAQETENDSIAYHKKGGICFRFDDNAEISTYLRVAEIFEKYDAKFSISLNLGSFWRENYADSISMIQQMGHEIMDHTPNHRTDFIETSFPILDYQIPGSSETIAGIDHINGNKLCLEYSAIDTNKASGSGLVNVNNDTITGDFENLDNSNIYLYFPIDSTLVKISKKNNDTLFVSDFWEDSTDLGKIENVQVLYFSKFGINLSTESIKILANETLKLADEYNLQRPQVWIQPGGNYPQLIKEELKEALGNDLNYIAGTGCIKGKQLYCEYDPLEDERFEMQWGDFFEDFWSLEETKSIISDRIAKHYMLIGHTHFYDLPNGLDSHLEKIDSLLNWCKINDIPIKTYSEWAEILYDLENNQYENIIPPLNKDIDENGIPDGYVERYWEGQGRLEIDIKAPSEENYCYAVNDAYRLCRIDYLAGIEKGSNDFEIWTKGEIGDSIEVIISFNDSSISDEIFKFPADTDGWKKYDLSNSTNGNNELIIPEKQSLINIDISCSDYVSGTVKVSGMSLKKSITTNIVETKETVPMEFSLNQNYPNPFNPTTQISYQIPEKSKVSLKVYDILGRELLTLVNAEQNVGHYLVNFDGHDLPSGIYFYTLFTDKFVQTHKMLLLK